MRTAIALLIITLFGSHISKADGGLLLYTRNGSSYVNAVKYKAFLIWNGSSYVTSESLNTPTESVRHIAAFGTNSPVRFKAYNAPSSHLFYVICEDDHQLQIESSGIIANIPFPHSPVIETTGDAKRMVDNIASLILTNAFPKYESLLHDAGIRWSRLVNWGDSESDRKSYRPIDLWNRYLELCRSRTPIRHSDGSKKIVPILHTKSGEIYTNVSILRFEGNKAVIQYTAGIGQILISDIVIEGDLTMPADVRSAIQAALKVLNVQKQRELQSQSKKPDPPLSTPSVKTPVSTQGTGDPVAGADESGTSISSTVPGN